MPGHRPALFNAAPPRYAMSSPLPSDRVEVAPGSFAASNVFDDTTPRTRLIRPARPQSPHGVAVPKIIAAGSSY